MSIASSERRARRQTLQKSAMAAAALTTLVASGPVASARSPAELESDFRRATSNFISNSFAVCGDDYFLKIAPNSEPAAGRSTAIFEYRHVAFHTVYQKYDELEQLRYHQTGIVYLAMTYEFTRTAQFGTTWDSWERGGRLNWVAADVKDGKLVFEENWGKTFDNSDIVQHLKCEDVPAEK